MQRDDRVWLSSAFALWGGSFVVIGVLVLVGQIPTVPYDVYASASRHWLNGQALYESSHIDGFQYFPQAAILFVPFAELGALGEVLWRAIGWASLALGVWRALDGIKKRPAWFLLATALLLPTCIGSLGNGQGNLLTAALLLNAAQDVAEKNFIRAGVLLALGLALKPLSLVPILLFGACYRPIRRPLTAALGAMLLVPFAFDSPGQVVAMWTQCFEKLAVSAEPDRHFEEVRGLLHVMGVDVLSSRLLLLRLLAAGGTLWLALHAPRDGKRALFIASLAAVYLMLFNPRTQPTSFVIAAPFCALLFGQALRDGRLRSRLLGCVLVAWSVSHYLITSVEHWLKPVGSLLFASTLMWSAFSAPHRTSVQPVSERK